MDKQRIGLVLPNAPAFSETFFNSKIKGLQAAGMEVTLFVNSQSGDYPHCKTVKAWRVTKNEPLLQMVNFILAFITLSFKAPEEAIMFVKLERKDGTGWKDVVEKLYINAHILPHKLHWLHFGFVTMGLRSENVAKAMGAKMAVSFRGYDVSVYPVKNKNCYQKLWQKIDKVHTISDDLYQIAITLGLPTNIPVEKITPAIEVKNFLNQSKRNKLHQPLQILSVARLHWKKGFEYSLKAMAILNEKGYTFQYNIIGTGIDYERLVFATEQLGLAGDVKLLGRKTSQEVSAYLAGADIYLQPSVQEGFCNAVLEAQAAGCICVVSNAEGLAENVLHGKTGWVVPKRNPEAIALAIKEIMELEEADLLKMRNFAVSRVQDEFNIDRQINKFIHFYNA